MIYRTDIDGLRAVAVSLVVIFHINETLVPGGFVGVDMFFVISGYLITGIILRDIEAGRFSFAEFYRRRAKRIFPAVFVVTLTTLLVGAWVLLPDDMVDLSKSALATMLFVANIFFTFELDTGYFANDSRTVPLLHMWSLGVEEQFYFIWPVLLLVFARAPKFCFSLLVILFILSIATGEFAIREGWFSFAYYMLPTRAFQLMAGAMLVLMERSNRLTFSPSMALFLGLCGLAALVWSVMFLHPEISYPGVHALPITTGTVLLLVSGRSTQPLAAILSLKPVRWLGLISFSLYLWHWPVLAFQRYLTPELDWAQQVVSLIIILLLSHLTYRLVEKPFREKQVTFWAALRRFWLYPVLCVGAISFAHTSSDGYGVYSLTDLKNRIENQGQPMFRLPFVCQTPRLTTKDVTSPSCVLGEVGAVNTLLIGDSNAAQFVGAFDEVAQVLGFRFRNIAHSACPPLFGDTRPFTLPRRSETCVQSRKVIETLPKKYETIILAASWDSYYNRGGDAFLNALEDTVAMYIENGSDVLLIGVIPRQPGFDRQCEFKKLKHSWIGCDTALAQADTPEVNSWLADLATWTPGVSYLDPYVGLCNETECPTFFSEDALYFDGGHLSYFGSKHLGNLWMRVDASNSVLSDIFEKR